MKRPSIAAILLGLIPFAATCFSVSAWDRIDPMVWGIPFNLFWLISWIVLTPVCMWAAYHVETSRSDKNSDATFRTGGAMPGNGSLLPRRSREKERQP